MHDYPKGDVWRLIDSDPDSQNYQRDFKFDFTFFQSEEIKTVVKEYIWTNHRTGSRVPKGLRESLWRFKYFDEFCRLNGMRSLQSLDNNLADDYRSFLRLWISPYSGKPLSYCYQSACFSTLKTLVGWCHAFLPDAVQSKQIFTGGEYRQVSSRLSIDFIPVEVLAAINEALKVESNLYLKCGIIILKCTGMRIGDLLHLRTECISEHPISGFTITWFDHKNRKSRVNMPIPFECNEAVGCLLQITEPLREQAACIEKTKLFIYKPRIGTHKKPIITVSRQTFTKWCRDFCEKHDIRDSGGNIFKLSTHMFRRTLATDMFSKDTNLKVIQEALGHSSPAVTKRHYSDIKDTNRAEMFLKIGILGNIHQINADNIPNSSELQGFKDNFEGKARLADGYCTMPIRDGKPCGRFLSRQKCYTCSRYITTLEDLDAHRSHLAELQDMLYTNIYGDHFAAHIIPTTIALKEIIRRLEELQNEQ